MGMPAKADVDDATKDALTGLAALFADRGDLKGAIGMLKQASEKSNDPRTIVTLAEFYEQNRQYNEAADTWQQARRVDREVAGFVDLYDNHIGLCAGAGGDAGDNNIADALAALDLDVFPA